MAAAAPAPAGAIASQISNNQGKVFVGGLAPQTTSDGLRAFYAEVFGATHAECTLVDRQCPASNQSPGSTAPEATQRW